MRMGAELGETQPEARDAGMAGIRQSRGRRGEGPALEPSGTACGADTLIPDSWPPELCKKECLLFQATRRWHLVWAALRDEHVGKNN